MLLFLKTAVSNPAMARTNTNPGAFFVGAGVAASGISVVTAAAPGEAAFTAVPLTPDIAKGEKDVVFASKYVNFSSLFFFSVARVIHSIPFHFNILISESVKPFDVIQEFSSLNFTTPSLMFLGTAKT